MHNARQQSGLKPRPYVLRPGVEIPRYWFAGNPFLTHFMNAFSAILPEGERFMIDSVRDSRASLPPEHPLQADISGFIGQEAFHARAHREANARFQAMGVSIDRLERMATQVLERMRALPPRQRVAVTGAVEHFTALFGELVMRHPEVAELVDPALRPLFVWHALEELEHKAVAYDLYEALDGDYLQRVLGLLRATLLVMSLVARGQLIFMWQDGSIRDFRAIARGLWWMFGSGRQAGYFRRALPGYLAFFRRDFHPGNVDDSELLASWQPLLDDLLAMDAVSA